MSEQDKIDDIKDWLREHHEADIIHFRAMLRAALAFIEGNCQHLYARHGKCDLCGEPWYPGRAKDFSD